VCVMFRSDELIYFFPESSHTAFAFRDVFYEGRSYLHWGAWILKLLLIGIKDSTNQAIFFYSF